MEAGCYKGRLVRKEGSWRKKRRQVTDMEQPTFVGPDFTRRPVKYERKMLFGV